MDSQSPSHIFVLGGSGRLGKDFISRALAKGHRVTALVRRANSLQSHEKLNVVVGSATSSFDIVNALTSIARQYSTPSPASKPRVAVIFMLGQTRANPHNPWSAVTSPALYMSQAAQALVDALRLTTGTSPTGPVPLLPLTVTKLVLCSMFGTADSWSNMHWLFRLVMTYSNMKQTIDDHNAVLEVVRANFSNPTTNVKDKEHGKLPTTYVVARPVAYKHDDNDNDQAGGEKAPALKEWGPDGSSQMGFMPSIDMRSVAEFCLAAVDDGKWDGTMPVISN